MRTLAAGLLAAQRADSGEPVLYIKVGATDYSDALKGLRHIEKPYGGIAVILLDNSDRSIVADLRGNKVTIGYGFEDEGVSNSSPLWVLTQTDVSREGQLLTQLQCIDAWQKLTLLRVAAGGGVELKGDTEGAFNIGMKVTGQTSAATGTVMAVGSGFIGVGKIANGPFVVAEVVKSDLYSSTQITVDTVTDYGGGSEPAWSGDKTILQIITDLTASVADVVLDSSDGIVDVTKPNYVAQFNTPYLDIIRDMMDYTKCAIRMEGDEKLHIFDVSAAPGAEDYEYDTDHCFFSDLRDTSLILPNRIVVVNAEQILTGMTPFSGSAEDAAAIARFMEVVQPIFADVQSDAAATELAESRLSRVQKEATRGTIEVPMNCGQELFDYIKVTDDRADITYNAWIGSLEREWEEGKYMLTIGLGGLSGAEGMPDDTEYPLPNIEQNPVPAVTPVGWIIPAAIQGYHHDIHFVADDYNTVSWGAGTIKFYDGTTQAVSAGSHNLVNGLVHHIYFNLDDASPNILKVTDDYLNVLTTKTGVLCLIQRGSDVDTKATVIPSYGKEPLITADVIYLTGLLDKLPDGTYGKVLSTCISAGRIRLDEVSGDLDDIDDGSTYAKVKSTDISAGHIELNSGTRVDGTWYEENGVIIDADDGVEIRGGKLTLADSDGDYASSLYIDGSGQLRLDPWIWTVTDNIMPTDNYCQLGKLDRMWQYVYAKAIIAQNFSITGNYADFGSLDYIEVSKVTSQPASGTGKLVLDTSDGYLKYYASGQWFKIQRTGGWN